MSVQFMADVYDKREPTDGQIPKDAIEISGSEYGESVVLFVRGLRAGQVWLKEWHALEYDQQTDPEANLTFIASDFDAFLACLIEEPTEPDSQGSGRS